MTTIPEGTLCQVCSKVKAKHFTDDALYLCNSCKRKSEISDDNLSDICPKCGCLYEDCICETT